MSKVPVWNIDYSEDYANEKTTFATSTDARRTIRYLSTYIGIVSIIWEADVST